MLGRAKLDLTVVNGISSAEEYGRHIIQESGHFEVDPNLEEYIDYPKYGERRIREEGGVFTDRGYLAYMGTDPQVEEILARNSQTIEETAQDPGSSFQHGQMI